MKVKQVSVLYKNGIHMLPLGKEKRYRDCDVSFDTLSQKGIAMAHTFVHGKLIADLHAVTRIQMSAPGICIEGLEMADGIGPKSQGTFYKQVWWVIV
jgi:hypothetical protein